MSRVNPGIEAVLHDIAECELDYREPLLAAMRGGNLRWEEPELLDRLYGYLPHLVDAFDTKVPAPSQRGGRPALGGDYLEWSHTSGDDEALLFALIRSFLAVETERQGMYRMSQPQYAMMADCYNAMGREFSRVGLSAHAATAFENAADVFLMLRKGAERDAALFNVRRERRKSETSAVARVWQAWIGALCGYGYRPYLLLFWMVGCVGFFSVAVWMASPVGFGYCLRDAVTNFVNPGMPWEIDRHYTETAQWFFMVEFGIGAVAVSAFLALLFRRWFQA